MLCHVFRDTHVRHAPSFRSLSAHCALAVRGGTSHSSPWMLRIAKIHTVTARDRRRRRPPFQSRPKWSCCRDQRALSCAGVGPAVEALRPRELGVLKTTMVVLNNSDRRADNRGCLPGFLFWSACSLLPRAPAVFFTVHGRSGVVASAPPVQLRIRTPTTRRNLLPLFL